MLIRTSVIIPQWPRSIIDQCVTEKVLCFIPVILNVFVLEINPSKFTEVHEYTTIYVFVKSVVSKVPNKRTIAPLV